MVLIKKWYYAFTEKAKRELSKIDKSTQKQILQYFEGVINTPNPRVKGSALKGNLRSYWRYRVGDYRVICRFEETVLTIIVVKVAHRREVYTQEL